MSANPDPGHITDPMWWLWETCESFIPGVRLGGIYANKSGYHNTVNSNKKSWPNDYSIRLPLDLTDPGNKARAIDLTMDDAQMMLRTGYLIASALHPEDDRLHGVREFYGTVDLVNVTGLSQTGTGDWQWVSSDSSHLWHIHGSEFTEFCDDMDAQRAFASALSGQSWEDWKSSGIAPPEEEEVFDMGVLMVARVDESDGMFTYWKGDGFYHQQISTEAVAKDLVAALASYYGSPRAVLLTYPGVPRDAVLDLIGPNPVPTGGNSGGGGGGGPAPTFVINGTFQGSADPE